MRTARALVVTFAAMFLAPQSPAADARPKFEVATIKRCAASQGHFGGTVSAGRIEINCFSVKNLISRAYVLFANGKRNPSPGGPITIEGGPGWADSDLYTITAKAEGTPLFGVMSGPMMQALLEDRFRLRLHHRPVEIPVYDLTVAKSGARLVTAKEVCVIEDFDHPHTAPLQGHPAPPVCDSPARTDHDMDLRGATLDQFSRALLLGRRVDNTTGIQGHYDFHLEYGGQLPPEGDSAAAGASLNPAEVALDRVRGALSKLGLKVDPGKGIGDAIVIDHLERPSEN